MPKLKLLLKETIKFLSTLLHNIFAVIVIGVIGVPTLVSWATGTLDILLQTIKSPTPLWAAIALVLLSVLYIRLKTSRIQSLSQPKKPRYFKYCPECNFGINAKNPEAYCQCGTKYLEKCPECNKKIIRDSSRICSFCGYNFPTKPKTGHEWMAR